ncbi:hypothetical protein M3M33_15300, partial [Loigolactobacillus coryniformis]|uniref:hypothetical protein n=1 Tax=Loigolactobacillus coryniformis TaxID=1610 RepID=UPI00201AF4B3
NGVRHEESMTDIVARLRERSGQYGEYDWHGDIELEAATEIEALRKKLARFSSETVCGDHAVVVRNNEWPSAALRKT